MRTTDAALLRATEHDTSGRRGDPPAADIDPLLTIEDLAAIYRCSVWTIKKRLAKREFRPEPWAMYPYRWRKVDVIADLNTRRIPAPRRRRRRRRASTN